MLFRGQHERTEISVLVLKPGSCYQADLPISRGELAPQDEEDGSLSVTSFFLKFCLD